MTGLKTPSSASSATLFIPLVPQFEKLAQKNGLGPAKGNLQPHVSNLPRRTKRAKPPVVLIRQLSRQSSDDSVAGSHSDEDSPAVVHVPLAPKPDLRTKKWHVGAVGTWAPSLMFEAPQKVPASISAEIRRREARKGTWEEKVVLQEVVPNSNVFVCFSYPSSDAHDSDVTPKDVFYDRVVRINDLLPSPSSSEDSSAGSITDGVPASAYDKAFAIVAPQDLARDHGISHLSTEQMQQVWSFLCSASPSKSNTNGARPHLSHSALPRRILISTSKERAVDAMAVAIGYIILSSPTPSSPLLSTTFPSMHANLSALSLGSNDSDHGVLAAAPALIRCNSQCKWSPADLEHVEGLPGVGHEEGDYEELEQGTTDGPVHRVLSHIHDYHEESFDDAWKGVISRDGIDWLENALLEYQEKQNRS